MTVNTKTVGEKTNCSMLLSSSTTIIFNNQYSNKFTILILLMGKKKEGQLGKIFLDNAVNSRRKCLSNVG